MNHRSRTRTLSHVAIIAFTLGLIIGLFTATPSDAHTPSPRACMLAWKAAPDGQRFAAKQRCVAAQRRHSCVTHPRHVPGFVRVKGQRLSRGPKPAYSPHWRNQRHVVGWTVREGLRRDLPRKVVLSALVAGTQESGLRELTWGDWTSVGPWQLTHYHGPEHLRVTVEYSGNWYYNKAMRIWRANPRIGVAALAQAVEVSAHPDLYAQWTAESTATLDAILGSCRLRTR